MRLKPSLLNLAAGLSLLLAIAIVVLWVRSYSRVDRVLRAWCTPAQLHTQAATSWGSEFSLMTNYTSGTFDPIDQTYNYVPFNPRSEPPPRWFPFPPIWFVHGVGAGYDQRGIVIAYWLVFLVTLPLPAVVIVRHRRRRHRETNNLCPTCGYDLRATPDRRPECGAASPRAV